jgi:hypothetical protein
MTTQKDEAVVQSEIDRAKREARKMIVDDLLDFADQHRPYIDQQGYLEREQVLAIDLVREDLMAWAAEGIQEIL